MSIRIGSNDVQEGNKMKIEAAAIAASEVCEAEVSSTISSDDETVGEEGTKANSKDS